MGGRAPRKEIEPNTASMSKTPSAESLASQICDGADVGEIPVQNDGDKPRKKKRGEDGRRTRGNPETRKKKNVFYRDMKVYEEAERNQVIFQPFSLVEEMETKTTPPLVGDAAWVLWDDAASRAALDRDGIPVLYHFPKQVMESDTIKYTNTCLNAGAKVVLTFGASGDGEDEGGKSSYVFTDGEVAGCVEFAHAVAQDGQPPRPSPSLTHGKEPLKEFMVETEFLSQRVNSLISLIDPSLYDGLEHLREIINECPDVQEYAKVDPILMEGRSIAFNQKTPLSSKVDQFESGWNVLISLGSFTEGGFVRIPRLGLRVRFLPGDMVVLRGTSLEHEVEAWSGGQRICLEHFTMDSLWKYAGVEL